MLLELTRAYSSSDCWIVSNDGTAQKIDTLDLQHSTIILRRIIYLSSSDYLPLMSWIKNVL